MSKIKALGCTLDEQIEYLINQAKREKDSSKEKLEIERLMAFLAEEWPEMSEDFWERAHKIKDKSTNLFYNIITLLAKTEEARKKINRQKQNVIMDYFINNDCWYRDLYLNIKIISEAAELWMDEKVSVDLTKNIINYMRNDELKQLVNVLNENPKEEAREIIYTNIEENLCFLISNNRDRHLNIIDSRRDLSAHSVLYKHIHITPQIIKAVYNAADTTKRSSNSNIIDSAESSEIKKKTIEMIKICNIAPELYNGEFYSNDYILDYGLSIQEMHQLTNILIMPVSKENVEEKLSGIQEIFAIKEENHNKKISMNDRVESIIKWKIRKVKEGKKFILRDKKTQKEQ